VAPSWISSRLQSNAYRQSGMRSGRRENIPELHVLQARNPSAGDSELHACVAQHEMVPAVRVHCPAS
jgi:hypothetical protein